MVPFHIAIFSLLHINFHVCLEAYTPHSGAFCTDPKSSDFGTCRPHTRKKAYHVNFTMSVNLIAMRSLDKHQENIVTDVVI